MKSDFSRWYEIYNSFKKDEWFGQDLPYLNFYVFHLLKNLLGIYSPENFIKALAFVIRRAIYRLDREEYTPENIETIFRLSEEIANKNKIQLEEFSKRKDIYHLFYNVFSEFSTIKDDIYEEWVPVTNSEFLLLADAVYDPEKVINKFMAGYYDYRIEYLRIAKLLKDWRLKGYFLDALDFYEKVPQEEFIYNSEEEISVIIEGVGNKGWDEFVKRLKPYLFTKNMGFRFPAISSLGKIGGDEATRLLKKFRRYSLEGFISIDEYESFYLDIHITLAEKGISGVLNLLKQNLSVDEIRSILHILVDYQDPMVIKAIYSLLKDPRKEKVEIHYMIDSKTYTHHQMYYPVREEAMMALESYDESYVIDIVGNEYKKKKEEFYSQMDQFLRKMGMERFSDEDEE